MNSSSALHTTYFAQGNQAFRKKQLAQSLQHYLGGALQLNNLHSQFEGNLERTRRAYRRQREGLAPRLAVCGWSLSHNPAGRVMALVDAYLPQLQQGTLAALEVIGALYPRWGEGTWGPMGELDVPLHTLLVEEDADFLPLALQFVAQHPFDVVLLSKPRFPNLVFGLLYQLVWDATVLWDIDDEELAFANGGAPLGLEEALGNHASLTINEPLHKPFWTQLCVGELGRFPVASVSNPALQQRYGGVVIPHVRNEQHFVPSAATREREREQLGIPEHAKVVLFLGTPRAHKGLLETAQGMASLGRDDMWFVVAGSFPNDKASKALKQALEAVEGLRLLFLEDQPFRRVPELASIGDACVLLQEGDSLVAQFQLPAKLVDALAMGMAVLARVTPATQWLAEAGVITPVTIDTFPAALQQLFSAQEGTQPQARNRSYFEQCLSVSAVQPQIASCLALMGHAPAAPHWQGRLQKMIEGDLRALLT